MQQGIWRDLGRLEYRAAWDVQREAAAQVKSGGPDTLLLVEHDPVLTLGAGFHAENLLASGAACRHAGVAVERTDRGGDVTYHGPGQLVMYPVFDLRRHGKDLHRWMRDLEETQIRLLAQFGLTGRRFPPHTGAWIGDKKVAAIGVKIGGWISTHGIALNCEPDLTGFRLIVPCGIKEYPVTSLSAELGRSVPRAEALPVAVAAFEAVFGLELRCA